MDNFCLRHASEDDASKILNLVTQTNLDTSNLEWIRFVVVETVDGMFVGCGQIKSHQDGSYELASVAVDKNYRGLGIGRMIIDYLLSKSERPLFLICRLKLCKFYQKFGFAQVHWDRVSPFYHKVRWIFVVDRVINFFTRRDHLIIMRLD